MQSQKPLRQSNFELLRIFAIFLVIYTHYSLYFNGIDEARGTGISDFFAQMLFVVSKSCVNLFLVLSGYFMVKMDVRRLKWGKVLTLLIMASFYLSVRDDLFLYMDASLTFPDIVRNLIPSSYYINIYCAVYIMSPFINKAFDFDRRTIRRFVLLAFLIFSVWPNVMNLLGWKLDYRFVGTYPTSLWSGEGGLTFINFTLCYIIGAYIRIENPFARIAMKWRVLAVLAISGILAAIGISMPGLVSTDAFTGYDSVLCIVQTAFIFSIFSGIRIGYHKWINAAAKATLVVYLTHEIFLRVFFKMYDLNSILPHSGIWFFVSSVACNIAIWVMCVAVYYVLTWVFAPLISRWQRTRLYNALIYSPSPRR